MQAVQKLDAKVTLQLPMMSMGHSNLSNSHQNQVPLWMWAALGPLGGMLHNRFAQLMLTLHAIFAQLSSNPTLFYIPLDTNSPAVTQKTDTTQGTRLWKMENRE